MDGHGSGRSMQDAGTVAGLRRRCRTARRDTTCRSAGSHWPGRRPTRRCRSRPGRRRRPRRGRRCRSARIDRPGRRCLAPSQLSALSHVAGGGPAHGACSCASARARAPVPAALLGQVADAGRGAAGHAGRLEAVRRTVIADSVAALGRVADVGAARQPAVLLASVGQSLTRPVAALGEVADAAGGATERAHRLDDIGRARRIEPVAEFGLVARFAGRRGAADDGRRRELIGRAGRSSGRCRPRRRRSRRRRPGSAVRPAHNRRSGSCRLRRCRSRRRRSRPSRCGRAGRRRGTGSPPCSTRSRCRWRRPDRTVRRESIAPLPHSELTVTVTKWPSFDSGARDGLPG